MPKIKEFLFQVSDAKRSGFWDGRAMTANICAATIYLIIAVVALVVALLSPKASAGMISSLSAEQRLLVIFLGVVVSAGPPAWFWIEARAFDDWVNLKTPDEKIEKRLRETFKLNADGEKAFWAAIVAVYAAVLLRW